jgi:hypothetical protein
MMQRGTRRVELRTIVAIIAVGTARFAAAGGILISSPSPGTVVSAGQIIAVTVEPKPGTVLQRVIAGIVPLSEIGVVESPPYQFAVQVPFGKLGTLTVGALALDTLGNTLQAFSTVEVRASSATTAVRVDPQRLLFSGVNGQVRSVSVSASFQDGTLAYVTNSPDTHYVSANPGVAVVNAAGQVRPVAAGTSELLVTYAGFTLRIPITVGVLPTSRAPTLFGVKATTRTTLLALLPAIDHRVAEELGEAIRRLDASLTSDLWSDESHLTRQGDRVFEEEKAAVQELIDIRSGHPSFGAAAIALTRVDRALAETALDEARLAGGRGKDLAAAQEDIGRGDDAAARGDLDDAIDRYEQAWRHAQHAVQRDKDNDGPDGDH